MNEQKMLGLAIADILCVLIKSKTSTASARNITVLQTTPEHGRGFGITRSEPQTQRWCYNHCQCEASQNQPFYMTEANAKHTVNPVIVFLSS